MDMLSLDINIGVLKKLSNYTQRMPLTGLMSLPHYPVGSLIGTVVMLPYLWV